MTSNFPYIRDTQSNFSYNGTEFSDVRIMLTDCPKDIQSHEIQSLCNQFGELLKPVHRPIRKNGPNTLFFVEYTNPSNAKNAIQSINADRSLGIKAAYATIRLQKSNKPSNNDRGNTSNADFDGHANKQGNKGAYPKKPFVKNQGHDNHPKSVQHHSHDEKFKGTQKSPPDATIVKAVLNNHVSPNSATGNGHYVPPPQNALVGPCLLCQTPTIRYCLDCMEPYCSENCQRQDWRRHKNVCRPVPGLSPAIQQSSPMHVQRQVPMQHQMPVQPLMPLSTIGYLPLPTPPLVPQQQPPQRFVSTTQNQIISPKRTNKQTSPPQAQPQEQMQLSDQITQKSNEIKANRLKSNPEPQHAPFPKSGDLVVITAAPAPGMLYVRPIDKKSNSDFQRIIQEVNEYAKNAKPLPNKPQRHFLGLAECKGMYCRAVILQPVQNDQNMMKIAFTDYGNVDEKHWRDLKILDDHNLICETRYNFRIVLKNVDYLKHTNDASVKLVQQCIAEQDQFEMFYEGQLSIKNTNKREAILIRHTDQMSLNDKIKELSTGAGHATSNEMVKFTSKNLIRKGVLNGNNLRLVVLDITLLQIGMFCCIMYNDLPKLSDIHDKVQNYCATDTEPYNPDEFELCLAEYEDEPGFKAWYRGQCAHPDDKAPTICFIDYGNMKTIDVSKIRKISRELALLPIYSKYCTVDGLSENNVQHLEVLEKYFVANQEIFVEEVTNVISDSKDMLDTYAVLSMKKVKKELIL